MSERDANKALTDTARLRVLRLESDPLELTQPLPVVTRRFRQHEARTSAELGTVEYNADDIPVRGVSEPGHERPRDWFTLAIRRGCSDE